MRLTIPTSDFIIWVWGAMTTFSRWSQLVRKNRLAASHGYVAIRKSGANVAYGSTADDEKQKFTRCEWLLSICISRLVCIGNNNSDTMPEVIFCVQH
jgi:hypothetical protein